MKNNKKVIMSLVVTSLVLITVGVTYAFFSYSRTGTTENAIRMGDITFLYEEIDKQGNGINIEDAVPVSDETGKQGRAFNFRITSTNTVNAPIPYQITARKVTDIENPLPDDAIKVYLTKVDSNDTTQETQVLLEKYSELPTLVYNNHDDEILWTDQVPAGSSNYSQSYRLRMWIVQDTDFSTGEYTDKQFSIKVNVYGGTAMQNEPDAPEITNITIPDGTVSPVLDTTLGYDYVTSELPSGTTSTTLNITTEDANDQVTVERVDGLGLNDIQSNIQRLSTTHNIPVTLSGSNNYFKITVKGRSKKKIEKIIKVVVAKSSVAGLNSLSIDNCPLNETFSSSTTSYTCQTLESNLTVTAQASNNGTYQVTGNTGLQVGTNTITVTVVAENGVNTKPYTITVTRLERAVSLRSAILDEYANGDVSNISTGPTSIRAVERTNSGLFKSASGQTYDDNKPTYYFRGNVDNNYVSFAGYKWKIVRINEDGSFRIFMIDELSGLAGKLFNDRSDFSQFYFTDSLGYERLSSWYEQSISNMPTSTNYKYSNYVSETSLENPKNYFCEHAMVTSSSSNTTKSGLTMESYSTYDVNFKCDPDTLGHGIVDTSFGTITYDEMVFAGAFYTGNSASHGHTPFYLNFEDTPAIGNYYFTMTPLWDSYVRYWGFYYTKLSNPTSNNTNFYIHPVVNLKSNVMVTGEGTSSIPWTVVYN